MEVGREIRRIREAKGWSQTKAAAGAEMSVSGLSQIETGARNPSAVTLAKLAAALGVEVSDFFVRVETPLPLETRFERFLAEAQGKPTDELARRNAELAERLEELAGDPARLPRKLGGQAAASELGRYLRELGEVADEAHAVTQVLWERTANRKAELELV